MSLWEQVAMIALDKVKANAVKVKAASVPSLFAWMGVRWKSGDVGTQRQHSGTGMAAHARVRLLRRSCKDITILTVN
jgi:hypothetical protein